MLRTTENYEEKMNDHLEDIIENFGRDNV